MLKKLNKTYEKEAEKLDKLVASYYGKYGEDGVIEYKNLLIDLTPEQREVLLDDNITFFDVNSGLEYLNNIERDKKINRLDELEYEITKQQIEIGKQEEKMGKQLLVGAFLLTYGKVVRDMGFNSLDIDKSKRVTMGEDIFNERWMNGNNYSTALWGNKKKLINFLVNDFKEGVIRGDNYQKMGKILKGRHIRRSPSDIKRLVYTEGTFYQNEAMSRPFKDMGYTHYFYDAVVDDRTSEICEGLDGEWFAFEDKVAGLNFPPLHP